MGPLWLQYAFSLTVLLNLHRLPAKSAAPLKTVNVGWVPFHVLAGDFQAVPGAGNSTPRLLALQEHAARFNPANLAVYMESPALNRLLKRYLQH